jgi:hypothetical protein
MYWSEPDAQPLPWDEYMVYSSAVSYDVMCLLTGYNADGSATMIRAPWVLNGSYTIDASVLTVAARDTDMVISKLPSGSTGHQIACNLDGTYLFIATTEWYDSSDDADLLCRLEYMTREPDAQTGVLGYPASGVGRNWSGYSSSFALSDHNALNQYVSLFPWAKETDGVLAYGLPYGVQYPTWPDQIYGESPASGNWYYWGSDTFTDPVRAVFLYNSKVYALLKTSTALQLWVEKDTLSDGGDDMQLIADTTLDDASVGIIAAVDGRDGTFVVCGVTDTKIVVAAAPPWTAWVNLTLSHRIDLDVTGVVVL